VVALATTTDILISVVIALLALALVWAILTR